MRTGLAAALAAMLVLPSLVILLAVYIFARGTICAEASALLEITLRQQATSLGQWLDDMEKDMWAFASVPHFAAALQGDSNPASPTPETPDLHSRFAEIQRIYGDRYAEFRVYDTSGILVYPVSPQASPHRDTLVGAALRAGKTVLANRTPDSVSVPLSLWLYAPIGARTAPWLGVLAMRVNPGFIFRLLDDPALALTGKAYLIDVERRSVTPLRTPAETMPSDAPVSEGIAMAMSGKTGVLQYHDHRGVDVIGAFMYLPSPRWGLVLEQDAEAALVGLSQLRANIILLVGLLAIGSVALSLGAAGRIVRHLERRDRQTTQRSEQMIAADKLSTAGIMAASVAHEINNPLTTINVLIHNLCEETSPALPQRMDLNIVLDEIAKIKNIVLRFLEFARPQEPEFSEVNVNAVVHRYCQLMRHQAAARGIELIERPGENLPPVVADAAQIGQVVLNVLLNAVEATPTRGTIELSTAFVARRAVCLRIFNTGPELKADQYEKIFEPFYSTKAQGTGLGLSIARMIVERHRGRIAAAAVPGKGTEFLVTLPVRRQADHRG